MRSGIPLAVVLLVGACLAAPAAAQMQDHKGGMPHGRVPALDMHHGIGMPTNVDTATTKPTDGKHYVAHIMAEKPPVAINRMHRWVLVLSTPDGKPVEGATVNVDGGMPAHGHGFPTTPRVTKYLGEGRYLVEGVKFNMVGWWEMKFAIAGKMPDSVTFNLMLK